MATRFSHSARIVGTLDSIYSTFGEEGFWVDRIRTVGTSRDSLDDLVVGDESISVTVTQFVPDSDIPDFARKVLPGELSLVRQVAYHRHADERLSGTSLAEAVGGLGKITGEGETVPEGGEAVESLEGRVKVSVPLLGSRLEKLVVEHITDLLVAEHDHLNRWLAGS